MTAEQQSAARWGTHRGLFPAGQARKSIGPLAPEGIPFAPDTQIKVRTDEVTWLTLSGYIPCPDPCGGSGYVPAVGNAGVGVLVVLLLAGGAIVISRRQRQAA